MIRLHTAIVFAVILIPATISGQTVVNTEKGPLEIIGLDEWSYQALEDSLARYAPGESLRSHACAAVLQQHLGFPSAAVSIYMGAQGQPRTYVVTIVEPQFSARATKRTMSAAAGADQWTAVRQVLTDSSSFASGFLQQHLQFFGRFQRESPDSLKEFLKNVFGAEEASRAIALFEAMAQHDQSADRALAISALTSDGNESNRAIAAAILASFPESDASWYALTAGLRDPNERVASLARTALKLMIQQGARTIDWSPAKDDLRPLLAGANAWAYAELLTVLTETEISPELAMTLLVDNGHLVLAHARAVYQGASSPAAKFLGHVSRMPDAGPQEWQEWIKGLSQQSGM